MAEPASWAYAAGSAVRVREVLHGAEWASWDEQVLSDDGTLLATVKPDGTAMTFADHPFPHPWGHLDAWQGTTVLKLRRAGDWYSVWRFFDADGTFLQWYINFETPYVRTESAIEVNDLQLDIVVTPHGEWRWKDVEDVAPALASGRMTTAELLDVLPAATEVADLLERDVRWWAPWDDWTPADGMI
ncbi:DUF402 domain-containing protein [Nocardioides hwasunensis]|uniref:DUF402 domain-containing protein n=1 Tax=Nocardioides hwasunensis TaxID=397258 RepID=A0ABR8MLI0_9ACTN|nr:DUF402 domain-containing protein [Nocardioides hwasunensis]MBD3916873.1 DUF402 domain-containing protein [Nocardioides hwasunensis]